MLSAAKIRRNDCILNTYQPIEEKGYQPKSIRLSFLALGVNLLTGGLLPLSRLKLVMELLKKYLDLNDNSIQYNLVGNL